MQLFFFWIANHPQKISTFPQTHGAAAPPSFGKYMTTPEVDGPIGYVTDLEGNVELWNRFIQCLGNIGNLVL